MALGSFKIIESEIALRNKTINNLIKQKKNNNNNNKSQSED